MYRCRSFCHNQGIYLGEYMQMTKHQGALHPSSVLRFRKVEFAFLLSGFFSMNNYDSQNSRERGSYLFMICLICLVSVMYVFSTAKSLFTGHLRIVLIFRILTIAPLISKFLLGNTRVIMEILQKFLGTFS